jgi:hypothetical protein
MTLMATVPEHPSTAFMDDPGRACRDVDREIFFPPKGGTGVPAKRICAACPVQADCLAWALATREPHGVWGGMSAWQRREMLGGRL